MAEHIKATKLEVLRFIQLREVIETNDLVDKFGYNYNGARSRLRRLEEQKLVEKLGIRKGAYCLTDEAIRRLDYYDRRKGS